MALPRGTWDPLGVNEIHALLWRLYRVGGWHRMRRAGGDDWSDAQQAEMLRRLRVVGRRYGFRAKNHRIDGQRVSVTLSVVARNSVRPPIGPEGLDPDREAYALTGHDQAELCCLDIQCRCAKPRTRRPLEVDMLPSMAAEVDPFSALGSLVLQR